MPLRDEARFVDFVAAAQERLRRTAYLMCGDWALAADATQEALLRLYVAWPRLEKQGRIHGYAHRALVSSLIDLQRKSKKRLQREHRFAGKEFTTPDGAQGHADRDLLMRGLKSLPPRQRACVVLRYYEDLSVAETAQALGCSTGTVKSQTSHAIAALRRTLGDQNLDGEPTTGPKEIFR